MMKCITLEYPDGSVATRGGVGRHMLKRFNGDSDAALQYIVEHLVPLQNPGAIARIEDIDFPPDRDFRGAWTRAQGRVEVSMPRARDIHMGRIREARDKELVRLDVETIKAVGSGDQAAMQAVEARKQRLRDLPQTLDLSAAKDTGQLSALWPPDLPK